MNDRVGMGIEQAGEKKQRGEDQYREREAGEKSVCRQGEGEGRKRGHRAFTWTDHASNSLSLVFPYLKTPLSAHHLSPGVTVVLVPS